MKQFKKNFWRSVNIYLLRLRVKRNSHSLRVVLGAGGVFQKGWIPTDIDTLNILKDSDWARYFRNDSIRALLAEHVWEHLDSLEGLVAARNSFNYLRRGGYLRLAVPDGFNPDPDYIEYVKVGGTGLGARDHKVLYNYISLSNMLNNSGFDIRLLEHFDENGVFIATDWDPEDGKIERSSRYDSRNVAGKLRYTSLIVDAFKT